MSGNSDSSNRDSLEQVMIRMQQKSPGCWDGKLRKFQDGSSVPYSEAEHGPNPLGQGFNICAPYSPGGDAPAGTRLQ
jgi:hypothetical protein